MESGSAVQKYAESIRDTLKKIDTSSKVERTKHTTLEPNSYRSC